MFVHMEDQRLFIIQTYELEKLFKMGRIMEKVIVVIGPTSVGKTKMGVALAKKFNGEVY